VRFRRECCARNYSGGHRASGRVVADVATRKTANVSASLLAAGHARSYNGGRRAGWCANAGK
jgi:hypothetical protein